jgi:hypothetical protein
MELPGGGYAIVCGPKPRGGRCWACKRPGTRLCDWKMGEGKTCDRPICSDHAETVAPNKDLCPEHQEAYRVWLAKRQAAS